jgi:TRAP-type C4-dicarboxylate transport system permease small subunit
MEVIDAFIGRVVTNIIEPATALLAVLAFLLFVYGGVNFIRNAENEEKRSTGIQHMFWAIIGLVIIFGANALLGFIGGTVDSVLP